MMKLLRAMLCFALFCLGPAANAGIVYFAESDSHLTPGGKSGD